MSEKEYKRSKLLELINSKPMTSKELADKLDIPMNQIFTYLAQYSKDGKVIKVGKKGKFNLYSAVESNPIELLKQLIDFMSNKCEVKGEVSETDSNLFKAIEKVIK